MTHLVRLVVVLMVIFKHLRLLLVVECPRQLICSKLFPPFFAVNEPANATELAPHPQPEGPLKHMTAWRIGQNIYWHSHQLRSLNIELPRPQKP